MNSNMALWEATRIPRIESLKKASTRGGFTTVQAQYQLERCTALWGPYGFEADDLGRPISGTGWGLRDKNWDWIYSNGVPVLVVLHAIFEHPDVAVGENMISAGCFEISTAWKVTEGDSDVVKKCETDAMSKALSKLGIDSDVFKGKWDGKTYVGDTPDLDLPRCTDEQQEEIKAMINDGLDGSLAEDFKSTFLTRNVSTITYEQFPEMIGKAIEVWTLSDGHKAQAKIRMDALEAEFNPEKLDEILVRLKRAQKSAA